MDRDKLRYRRHDNKFLWVQDWQRAQRLLDEQLRTDWQHELDALQQQVHPLHPQHLGRMPVKYNWTAFQSEWATDIAFRRQEELEPWFERWLRQAMLSYDHNDILGFFGHAPSLYLKGRNRIETSVLANFEGRRIKHCVGSNSLKLYHEANVLRTETTLNNAESIYVCRPPADDPAGTAKRRPMRRSVVDLPQRADFCQAVNERYVQALADTAETRTVRELAEPLTRRVPEPSRKSGSATRYVRGLNPLAEVRCGVADGDQRPALDGAGPAEPRPCGRVVPDSYRKSRRTPTTFGPRDSLVALAARPQTLGQNSRQSPLPGRRRSPNPHSGAAGMPQRKPRPTRGKRRMIREILAPSEESHP
jgi:hypothetical protein